MTEYSEGDWVKYRSGGIYVTKKVLEVRPDGVLVTGEHEHDQDTHTVQQDDDSLKKVE